MRKALERKKKDVKIQIKRLKMKKKEENQMVETKEFAELQKKLTEIEEYYENALTEHERHIAKDLIEPQLNELKELHTHQAENDQIIHVEIYEMINSNKEVLLSCILGTTLSKEAKRMLLEKLDGDRLSGGTDKASGGKKDNSGVEVPNKEKGNIPQLGIKRVAIQPSMLTDEKPPEPNFLEWDLNYNEPREDEPFICQVINKECPKADTWQYGDCKSCKEKPDEPKCPFCGRNLIWYKETWICGHGCTKPAVKPDEPREASEGKTEKKEERC